jgi:hypothetical protein
MQNETDDDRRWRNVIWILVLVTALVLDRVGIAAGIAPRVRPSWPGARQQA